VIVNLDRVVPAAAGKPARPGAAEAQRFAACVALSPQVWTRELAQGVATRFGELAEGWDAQRGSYRPTPMADALSRGGPWPAGLCVEVGSGTGLLTPLLAQLWDPVLCVDLSAAMLRRGRGLRVQADAARLPVPDGVAATVVIGDALLFAGEVVRALRFDGAVVWSNALGDGAPYHVPTPSLVTALSAASDGAAWDAVESQAGWGSWAVLRRAGAPRGG
jgi:SAM-dependent methyltransferase